MSDDTPTPAPEEPQLGSMVGTLQHTVTGLQQTLSTTYQSMVGNLKQSVQMMEAMNSMMEDFLLQSVHVKTQLETRGTSVAARVSLRNSSRVPIASVSASLSFAAPSSAVSPEVEHELDVAMEVSVDSAAAASVELPVVILEVDVLAPGETRAVEVTLQSPVLARRNGVVTVGFPSPGTQQQLSRAHTFGVYLVHQCHTSFALSPDDLEPELAELAASCAPTDEPISARTDALRRVFNVPPAAGIPTGSCFTVVRSDSPLTAVVLCVASLLDDGHRADLLVAESPSATKAFLTSARVVEELERLAN